MDMDMNKHIITTILSVISVAFSVYAAFVCDKRISADWMAILVGILALLVTVLIGMNLYTLVDFNNERKKVEDMKKEMDKKEMEIYNRSEKNLIEFHMSVFYTHISKEDKDCKDAYQIVLSGLSAMIHQSNIGLYKECEITARSMLIEKDIISMLKISKQSKESLLNMLAHINGFQNIGSYTDLMHALYSVIPVQS